MSARFPLSLHPNSMAKIISKKKGGLDTLVMPGVGK